MSASTALLLAIGSPISPISTTHHDAPLRSTCSILFSYLFFSDPWTNALSPSHSLLDKKNDRQRTRICSSVRGLMGIIGRLGTCVLCVTVGRLARPRAASSAQGAQLQ